MPTLRVAEDDVKEIIDTDVNTLPFIKFANLIINNLMASSGYDTDTLFEIERWLSAHLVAVRDPRSVSESIGGASISFPNVYGKGLQSTLYGQHVLMLDNLGLLLGAGRRLAKMSVISERD